MLLTSWLRRKLQRIRSVRLDRGTQTNRWRRSLLSTTCQSLEPRWVLAAPNPFNLSTLSAANGGNGSAGFTVDGITFEDDTRGAANAGTSVGDVNGDGLDDLFFGADLVNLTAKSYLVFGTPEGTRSAVDASTLNGANGYVFSFPALGGIASSHTNVTGAGDVNGDGIDDLVFSIMGGVFGGGSILVFGGLANLQSLDTLLPGQIADGQISLDNIDIAHGFIIDSAANGFASVVSAGDVNGDGFSDLLFGAPLEILGRTVDYTYLMFGGLSNLRTLAGTTVSRPDLNSIDVSELDGVTGFVFAGVTTTDDSGGAVSGAGDVNGDGCDDLLIGAALADANGITDSGQAYLVYGGLSNLQRLDTAGGGTADGQVNLSRLDVTTGLKLNGTTSGGQVGYAVSGAGDVDGDGFADLWIGSHNAESFLVLGGATHLQALDSAAGGAVDGAFNLSAVDGVNSFRFTDTNTFGETLSNTGDVNADGYDDLLVASNGFQDRAFVVFGGLANLQSLDLAGGGGADGNIDLSPGGGGFILNGTNGFRLAADASPVPDGLGESLGFGGDVNGDGFDDVLTQTPDAVVTPNPIGQAYLVFGANFTNGVAQVGNANANTLTGTGVGEGLVGGRGDDTLTGNGGTDVLRGGSGNDVLAVSDLTFRKVVGGHGTDTLRLDGGGLALDLTTLADNKLTSIEVIDLRGSGANSLTFNDLEVLNITSGSNAEGTANTLRIRRDSNDTVNMGTGWTLGNTVVLSGISYQVFTQRAATLLVEIPIPPGITIVQSSGSTNVNELGTTDTFTVVLNTQPASNVILTVVSGDVGEATVSSPTLTFTPANWDVPQTVTVTGVDDLLLDGNQTTAITLSVDQPNSDDAFDVLANQNVSVVTLDNDAPGYTVTQSGTGTSVSESGTDTFDVVLNAQPASNVVILVSGNDSTEASLNTTTLTFTPVNWNVAQTVTVAGVADLIVDGNQLSTITVSIDDPNSDNSFDLLPNQTFNVLTIDDDVAVFNIANTTASEGNGLVFTITLSKPSDVATSVTFTTSDGTALLADNDYSAVVSQTLVFAAGITSRTVTVNTTSDTKVEPDETLTATLGGLNNGGRNISLPGSNSVATGTILNNDTEVTLDLAPSVVLEDSATSLLFTFTRLGVAAGPLTVNFAVGGTATFSTTPALSDFSQSGASSFSATTGTVVFANGASTANVTITPRADSVTELDETVSLSIVPGAGYLLGSANAATGTVRDDDPALISMSLSPNVVAEDGAANLTYTFTRFGSLSSPLTVNFNVGGTATFGVDYIPLGSASFSSTSGSVTFAAGSNTATVSLDPSVDSTIEGDETVSLTVVPGPGYLPPASPGPVTGMINNDEFDVSMTFAPDTIAEDAVGTLTGTLTRAGGTNLPLTVRLLVGGSAFFGFDYSQTGASVFNAGSAFVTFASGASTATLQIDPTADTTIEPDETIDLTLQPGNDYRVTGTATFQGTILTDDQRVTLASSITSVTEDGNSNLVFTFTRSGATAGALSIPFTLAGTATITTDYVPSGDASFTPTGGQLMFAAGVTTATLTFDPVVDNTIEPDEVVQLTLPVNSPLGVTSAIVATGTIFNDDANVIVAASTDRVAEEGAANLGYTFYRFGDTSGPLTINFNVSGSATFDSDYTQSGAATFTTTSGTVTFAPGAATTTVTLDPTPDGLIEPNETAILTVVSGAGYSASGAPATGTIINQVATVSLSVTPAIVSEVGSTNLVYQFTRTGNLSGEATVFFTVGGSAVFAADYSQSGAASFSATEGSVTFAPGASTATITVDPSIDSIFESCETVVLAIVPDAERYTISGTGTATGTIVEAPEISVVVSPASVSEDGTPNLIFTFNRTGLATGSLTVNFEVGGSATFGSDYSQSGAGSFSTTAGTVTFDSGVTTKTVTINPTADILVEADETVLLTVVSGNGYSVASDSTATGTITNDDLNLGNIVSLDASGRLRIADPVDRDDRLKVVKNSANELVITDSANRLTTNIGRLVSNQEIRVPLSSLRTKTLIVELNGGADRIDLSGIPANLLSVTVYGGAGNDTIFGSGGNDTLLGGDGDDSIDGGLGNDGITGDAGNDQLNGNSGNDTILGGAGDDYLLGGAGNDRLVGQGGADRVVGQAGIDRIAGGSGFGRDPGDIVTDLAAEIDEAFRISFDGTKFLLI